MFFGSRSTRHRRYLWQTKNLAEEKGRATKERRKEGHGVEEIANMLSIPKGEVKLVLDLREKFSQIGSKEGVY